MSFHGYLKQSTTVTISVGPLVDSSDGNTEETGQTVQDTDFYLSKNGAAKANPSDTNDATEDANGIYRKQLDATDTGTLGLLTVYLHHSSGLYLRQDYQVVTANWYDTMCSSDQLDVNVTNVNGTSQTANDMSGDIDTILSRIVGTLASGTHNPQSGDAYARLGAPVGASISDDIATVDGNVDTIVGKLPTNNIADDTDIDTQLATIAGYIDTEITTIITHLTDIKGGGWTDENLTTIDSLIDAIKAVTDNLPNSGALTDIDTGVNNIEAKLPTNYIMGSSVQTDKDDEIDGIKTVTDNLPNSGALTDIDTGVNNIEAKLPSKSYLMGSADADGGFDTEAKSDVNAEVVDCLNTDTYAEPGQEAPAATNTLVKKIGYLYKFLRNKIDNDGTDIQVYADNGTTVDHTAPVSESAGTVTRGEFISGP